MYFERPDNMAQALSALTSSKAKALAGGTNIMVDIKKGRETGSHFVSLDALDELKKIEDKADGIHVGSLVTFTMLEEAMARVPKAYKALLQAGASVGRTTDQKPGNHRRQYFMCISLIGQYAGASCAGCVP